MGSFLIVFFCLSNCKKTTEVKREVNYIPYYLKVYEADSLYWTGNYECSFEILDSLFKEYEPLNQIETRELQTYAMVAYLTGHYGVLKPTVKKLVTTWDYRHKYIEYDSLMSEVWNKANVYKEEITQWEQECKNNINRTLKDTLIAMHKVDQQFRGKKGEDSLDIVHIKLLKYIFKKYGYPDFRMVGYPKYEEMVDLRVVYNHISDDVNENEYKFFQDELLRFTKMGTASPDYLAYLVDKRSFDREKKTVYGTFGTHESFGEKMVRFDTIQINKNRKSIGLSSIEYQEFKWNIHESMFNQ